MRRYDLLVIGGGTAGLVAAMGAVGVGARVLLAEAARTGGDCLWTGCVPSKSLIASAALAHDMRHADRMGLHPLEPEVDLGRIMDRIRDVQATIAPHDSPDRLRAAGVEVLHGRARFVRDGVAEVDGHRVGYRSALVATGSRPVLPPIEGLEDAGPLTSDTVWDLRELPRRLVVLGGGPIGCELAQAFQRLGSRVTLVEMADRLLLREELDAAELVEEAMTEDGVDVRCSTTATAVRDGTDGPELVTTGDDGERRLPFDRLLVAVGRAPVTDGLGLDDVGVERSPSGAIAVDGRLATTGRRIFAAGDVVDGPRFTHVAAYEAGLVVTNALFHLRRKVELERVPWATFTTPQVGRVGLTEDEARQRYGDDVTVARLPYEQVDRAVTAARTRGFAKLVAGPRDRLVGATVVGPEGSETIAEMTAWIAKGGTLMDVSRTVHTYPTFSMSTKGAADAVLRERWFGPRTRMLARPVLALLRAIER